MPWGSMGSIWAEFGLDYTKFQQGVQQVTKELVTLDGKYREAARKMEQTVNTSLEKLGATISAASSKQQLLGDSFDGSAAKAHALEQALDELLMAGVSPTNERVQELAQELKNMQTRMEEAARAAEQMARETESVGQRVQALAQQMTQVGSQMSIGLTLPLTALTGFAAKASMDFESAMAKVWTITDMTKSQLDSLGSQLERLSSSIPQSAQQLAAGLYDAIGSGITDVAEAMQVLEVAAKAGQAGATSTAVAMDALTSAINAYGMEASQAGELADVMFRAMDKGKLTFEEIAGNLGQVISTAAVAGVQFEEIAAAFATLTKGGVGAAEAATAVNQAILTIIQPSEEAAKYAEQLGIEFNAAALASKGLSGVLEDVYQATGGNIESMTTLFSNVRALKGALGLTRNEMQDYKSDLDSMATASGAAERAFEKQMQTSAAQAQLLKNEIANLGRAFGAELLPMLNSAIERIKPLIQAFADLPTGAKQAAIVFATVTAAIGPLMAAVGGLVTLMSGPAGWIVAIAAVGSALYGLVSSIRDVDGQTTRMIQSAQDTIDKLKDQAQEYGNNARALNDLLVKYEDLAEKSKTSETAQKELQEVVKRIGEIAPGVVTQWNDVGEAIAINSDKAKEAVREMLEARKVLLEVAAERAKIEKPRLDQIVRENQARVDEARKRQDEAIKRQAQAAVSAAQAELYAAKAEKASRDELDKLRGEMVTKGIMTEDEAAVKMPIWQVSEQWALKLKQANAELTAANENAKKVSTAFYDAQEGLAQMAVDAAELDAIVEQLGKGDLWAGLEPDSGKKGNKAVTTPIGQINAGIEEDLTVFDQWTRKIRSLDKTAYKALQDEWEDIVRGMQSDDIVVQTYAEQRASALIGIMTRTIQETGADFLKAAAAASVEVKSGYASLQKAAKDGESELAKALKGFQHDVAMGRIVGIDAQIAELERLKNAHAGTVEEQQRIDEQVHRLKEAKAQEASRSLLDQYRLESQIYKYTADDHVAHLTRILDDARVSAEDRKKLSEDLQLWEARAADEAAAYKRQVNDAWNEYWVASGEKARSDILKDEVALRQHELEEAQRTGRGIEAAEVALTDAKLALNQQLRREARDLHDFEVAMGRKTTEEQLQWVQDALEAIDLTAAERRQLQLEEHALEKRLNLEKTQGIIDRYDIESRNVEELQRTQRELGALYDQLAAKGDVWEDATEAVAEALKTVAQNLDIALDRQTELDLNEMRETYDGTVESAKTYMDLLDRVQAAHTKYSQEWLAIEREKERVQSDIFKAVAEQAVAQMGVFADLTDEQLLAGRKMLTEEIETFRGYGKEANAAVAVLEAALSKLVTVERNRYDVLVAMDKLTTGERMERLTAWLALVEAGSNEEKQLLLELFDVKQELRQEEAQRNIDSWLTIMPDTMESINEARTGIGNLMRQAEVFARVVGPEYKAAMEIYADALKALNDEAERLMTDEERRLREERQQREDTLRNMYVTDPTKYMAEYKQLLEDMIAELEAHGEKWSNEWKSYSDALAQVIVEENRQAAQAMLDGLTPLHELEFGELDKRYETLALAKKQYEALEDAGVAAVQAITAAMQELTRTEQALFADMARRGELTTQAQIDQIDRWLARQKDGTVEYSRLVTQRFDLEKRLLREQAEANIAAIQDLSAATPTQLIDWQHQVEEWRESVLDPVGEEALRVYDDILERIMEQIPKTRSQGHVTAMQDVLKAFGPIDRLVDFDGFRSTLREWESYYITHHKDTSEEVLKIIRDALAEADEAEEIRYRNAIARSEVSLEQQISDIEELMKAEELAGGKLSNVYEELATKRHMLRRQLLQQTAKDEIAALGDLSTMSVAQLQDAYNELERLHVEAVEGGAEAALAADAYAGALNRVMEQIMRTTDAELDSSMARAREEYRTGVLSAEQYKHILVMRRKGLEEWSDAWIAIGLEIEQVTGEIYRRMAAHTVEMLGPLDELTGQARRDAIAMLEDEQAVYASMKHGAAAAQELSKAIQQLTGDQDEWARTMAGIDAQLATSFEDRIAAIYDDAVKLMSQTDDPDEVYRILQAAAISAAPVYAEQARESIDDIRKQYSESAIDQIKHLTQLQGRYRSLGLAGVLAVAEIQKVMDSLNLSIEATTALLKLQVDAWQVDPLTVDLDNLATQKETYLGLVEDAALVDEWFAQQASKATEAAIAKRIGATERMTEHDVAKAEETLDAIRAIVAERIGVESDAMQAIEAMTAQLAHRRIELEEEAESRRQRLALSVQEELAQLRGEDDEAFMLSLERKIQGFRDAGWSEVQILEWVFAHRDKVLRDREESEYQLRKRLGTLSIQDQLKHEQELAEASQTNANARADAAGRMYEVVMGLAREAKLDELKGIRETMKALQLKYEAMGEGWELYALAAKMALEQVDSMIGDREKSWGKALADNILRNLGAVGDVIISYQRNAATYENPVDALIMTLAELVMKSRQFAALVDALNPLIEELIDMFGQLIAPLVPIVDILVRILTPVIRAVAAVFAWVADVVVGIWNAIAKTINALLGWLGVHIPTIEADWRKDYGLDKDQGGKAGTQISEITGPTRDLLVELMRPLRVLDSLPVYAASVERAIYSMRDAFEAYAGGQAAANGAAEAVVNNYYSINTIQIFSSGEEDFDQLMQSLNRRADLALQGSGA